MVSNLYSAKIKGKISTHTTTNTSFIKSEQGICIGKRDNPKSKTLNLAKWLTHLSGYLMLMSSILDNVLDFLKFSYLCILNQFRPYFIV